jgi:hypothetical protein
VTYFKALLHSVAVGSEINQVKPHRGYELYPILDTNLAPIEKEA